MQRRWTPQHTLVTTGTVLEEDVAEFLSLEQELPQRFPEVTSPVVARSMDFSCVEDFRGLDIIEKAGTVIAHTAALRSPLPLQLRAGATHVAASRRWRDRGEVGADPGCDARAAFVLMDQKRGRR